MRTHIPAPALESERVITASTHVPDRLGPADLADHREPRRLAASRHGHARPCCAIIVA